MNRIEHLLTVLMEECAEVQQACSKALRFGLQDGYPSSGTTNAQDIEKEFIEALAVRDMLRDFGAIGRITNAPTVYSEKRRRVTKFMEYADSRGTLAQNSSTAGATPFAEPKGAEVIKSVVADYYGIPVINLYNSSKRRRYVTPRWVAMSLTRDLLMLSYPDLGETFNRDHTSVIHGINRLQDLRQKAPDIERDYQVLLDELTFRISQYNQEAKQ